jgi:chaperone modulatory protein CbpM
VNDFLKGQLVDESVEFTLAQLCRISGASERDVMLWVDEGAFEPRGDTPEQWRFSGASLKRVRIACHLAEDLEINAPGIALALELLEEIEALRARMK